MRAAEFAVARAEHELQLARARLKPSSGGGGTVTVVAPVDGVVLKRLRESASVVPVGEPLLEIGDPASLEIVSDLLSTDAVRVSRGAPVHHRPVGRQRASRRTRPPRRAVRLHEGVGARRRGAARQRRDRFAGETESRQPRRRLSRRGAHRDLAGRPRSSRCRSASLFRRGEDWAVFVVDGGRGAIAAACSSASATTGKRRC